METELENHLETLRDRYHGRDDSNVDHRHTFSFLAERGDESVAGQCQ